LPPKEVSEGKDCPFIWVNMYGVITIEKTLSKRMLITYWNFYIKH